MPRAINKIVVRLEAGTNWIAALIGCQIISRTSAFPN
jgi:hypothetical protein